jgi:hypothetical protein
MVFLTPLEKVLTVREVEAPPVFPDSSKIIHYAVLFAHFLVLLNKKTGNIRTK